MRKLKANLVICFWSILFGEVIGFLASRLEHESYNFLEVGAVTAVCALIIVNVVPTIMKNANNGNTKK